MAAQRELPCNQCTGTSTALQRLEGFANRLFHRHSKGALQEQKVALENESHHFSELAALWDRSSKCSVGTQDSVCMLIKRLYIVNRQTRVYSISLFVV